MRTRLPLSDGHNTPIFTATGFAHVAKAPFALKERELL
jgi:hypothetical protein